MNTKEQILETAESLFNEQGYTAVGVDQIRDTAAISKTSMYRHFGSKNKLIQAVLTQRHLRFEHALKQIISTNMSTEEKLSTMIDWHFEWFHSNTFKGCMFMHAVAEFKMSDDEITELASAHKRWLKSFIKTLLEEDPNLNKKQLDTKAETIMTFIEGMIIRAEFNHELAPKSVYQHAIQALFKADF